jgi:hypothetical protein
MEALRFCRDFVDTLSDDFGVAVVAMSAPPAPFVPEQYKGATGYALLLGGFGAPEDHQRVVEQVRAGMPPHFELVTPIPYAQLQQMLDEGNPWGVQGYEKTLFLGELTDEAIAVVTEHVPRKGSPLSNAPIFVLGGAYARMGEDETACGTDRKARSVIIIQGITPAPEQFEAERAWVRAFYDALRPFASSAGGYVNTLAEDEGDRVLATYGAAKYERLARIKAAYDPENIFHVNQNIKPA